MRWFRPRVSTTTPEPAATPTPEESANRGNETPPPLTQASDQTHEVQPQESETGETATSSGEETPTQEAETSEPQEDPTSPPTPEATAVLPARTPETALRAVLIPRRLRVTDNQENGFTVRWDAAPGASRYRVEFLTGGQNGWRTLDESITVTEYTASGIACDIQYQTRVSAYGNGKDYRSEWGSATTPVKSRTGICTNLVITGKPYHFTLLNHRPEGYFLTRITVNSSSRARELKYEITGGNEDEIFAIDEFTGDITVADNLKSSSRRWISMEVTVTDSERIINSEEDSDQTQVTIDLRESHTPTMGAVEVQKVDRNTVTLSWPHIPGIANYRVAYWRSGWGDPGDKLRLHHGDFSHGDRPGLRKTIQLHLCRTGRRRPLPQDLGAGHVPQPGHRRLREAGL